MGQRHGGRLPSCRGGTPAARLQLVVVTPPTTAGDTAQRGHICNKTQYCTEYVHHVLCESRTFVREATMSPWPANEACSPVWRTARAGLADCVPFMA